MARLALLSVSNKSGLVALAQTLVQEFGFTLVSSGGTAQALKDADLPVIKVAEHTGSPEILGGRVKTLHPRIHGGILARRDRADDRADLAANDIPAIELVVVNLYPFEQTIAQPGVALSDAIEQIDIGGPTLVRASAKNHAFVTILCDPSQYDAYLQELRQQGGEPSLAFRQACALKAFEHTAAYDRAITAYLSQHFQAEGEIRPLPETLLVSGQQHQSLRYGENPHQAAVWYRSGTTPRGWAAATQMQGKELSYNNLVDLEAARALIAEFGPEQAAVAILKHTNPCGVALGDDLAETYDRAFKADATSAFGGIVALNQAIDGATAERLSQTFLECILAPACDPDAAAILQKKSKLRLLILPDLTTGEPITVKVIAGGFLAQTADRGNTEDMDTHTWQVVTQKQPTPAEMVELLFAWKVVKHVKSNAIVVTRDRTTVGVGAGQMNRVGAVQIALTQAGEQAQGAVLASDAFFPFADSVQAAAAAGVSAIVQPGGSVRDADSIQAANDLGIAMVFTGKRHFLH
ncbi:bifunctional phosphoribosylaminoimidazolecarboxamide formyltransferase/IMP cyclohydrolase [Trichothermofontia sp.]